MELGVGQHFGEWWGFGIQRGYGLHERRFSLFNTGRWSDPAVRPACCGVVPVLADGDFTGASFAEANLNSARLRDADFARANFADANLLRADIRGADLSAARGLTQAQINSACGDEDTGLPRGLTVRECRGPSAPPRPPAPPSAPRQVMVMAGGN